MTNIAILHMFLTIVELLLAIQELCPFYRPQTVFLHVSVSHSVQSGAGVSQHALQVVSQHALQVSRGRGCVSQLALQVSRPTPGEGLRALARGVSRPTPRREVEGSGQSEGLQAHSLGSVQAHTWGDSRPTPRRYIPACTEADSLPPADGYCCAWYASYWNVFLSSESLK